MSTILPRDEDGPPDVRWCGGCYRDHPIGDFGQKRSGELHAMCRKRTAYNRAYQRELRQRRQEKPQP